MAKFRSRLTVGPSALNRKIGVRILTPEPTDTRALEQFEYSPNGITGAPSSRPRKEGPFRREDWHLLQSHKLLGESSILSSATMKYIEEQIWWTTAELEGMLFNSLTKVDAKDEEGYMTPGKYRVVDGKLYRIISGETPM